MKPEETELLPLYVRARRVEPRTREVPTSEGIPVRLPISPVLPRIYAFLMDNIFVTLLTALFVFVAALIGGIAGIANAAGYVSLIAMMAIFLLRNFYFMCFELFMQGRTPGKRMFNLRVVDRNGQALNADALFVRNVTRDVETFLPLVALVQPAAFFPNAAGWAALASTIWLLVFALLPLFNRERLRAGDLLANTMVVSTAERKVLVDDVAIGTWMRVRNDRPLYTFRAEQLDMYGIFELEVLEEVLAPTRQGFDQEVLNGISRQVQYKIGWRDPNVNAWQFLQDFYSALRARHERRVMLGHRQEMKAEGILPPTHSVKMLATLPSGTFGAATMETPAVQREEVGVE